jgi:hypothetical protein
MLLRSECRCSSFTKYHMLFFRENRTDIFDKAILAQKKLRNETHCQPYSIEKQTGGQSDRIAGGQVGNGTGKV